MGLLDSVPEGPSDEPRPETIEPRSGLGRRTVLAVLALAVVTAVVVAWPRVQALLDRAIPARVAARTIGTSLLILGDTVGAVEISGAEIRLFKGQLLLAVTEPREASDDPSMNHFHVRATAADTPTSSLDACIFGMGDSTEKRLKDVAEAFVGVAFPAVLSRFKGEPMLGARVFWGDEPWAVPGMHGYLGPVRSRGPVNAAPFVDAPLFSGLPSLPRDGNVHLLKAVLYSKDGFWLRTLELDDHGTAIADQRFAPLDPQAKPGGIVRFAVFDRPATPAAPAARDHAFERLAAREPWLFTAEACPAVLIPASLPAFSFSLTGCDGARLHDCLLECQRGAASFCYMAALEVQAAEHDAAAAQALFLRSCRLGFASGCTNAAAGRIGPDRQMDQCSVRTFRQICERSGDPWACTMFGAELARGESTARDPVRARTMLAKACRTDEEDPACQAARRILARLDTSPARRRGED